MMKIEVFIVKKMINQKANQMKTYVARTSKSSAATFLESLSNIDEAYKILLTYYNICYRNLVKVSVYFADIIRNK